MNSLAFFVLAFLCPLARLGRRDRLSRANLLQRGPVPGVSVRFWTSDSEPWDQGIEEQELKELARWHGTSFVHGGETVYQAFPTSPTPTTTPSSCRTRCLDLETRASCES
jgi:hypothetical protein